MTRSRCRRGDLPASLREGDFVANQKTKLPDGLSEAGDKKDGGAPGADENAEAGASPNPKKRKLIIIGAAAALLVVGGGGGALFMMSGGDKPKAEEAAEAEEEEAPAEGEGEGKENVFVDTPPMTVNLRTADGSARFLKIHFMLVPGKATSDAITKKLPLVLDSYQPFLRELRPEDLSGSAATFRMKEEMLIRANAVLGKAAVRDVLIQDLTQQ
jgi:flagellar FliL protein